MPKVLFPLSNHKLLHNATKSLLDYLARSVIIHMRVASHTCRACEIGSAQWKGKAMAKLGRRQRLAKRKVQEAERQLAHARKASEVKLSQGLLNLPKRERLMLLGVQHEGAALTASNLKGHTHYAGAYVGRSPGVGNSDKLIKERRKHQGNRFAPAFMALGHESLKTEGTKTEFVLVKVPPNKKFIKQDKLS